MGLFMKKLLLVVWTASYLFAAGSTVGLVEYKADCRSCHGAPYKGSNMLLGSEWEEMFANSFSKLKAVHAKDVKATELLNSEKFNGTSKKLLEFLRDNAQDSGTVRGCSGTSCG
jgi:hypothetical protein